MTDRQEVSMEDLERLAAAMAAAIPDLDCPECCECNWVYHYVQRSADMYLDELEWACLAHAMVRHRSTRHKQRPA